MGQFGSVHSAVQMKLLVVLALLAYVVAEPEAEAKADPYIPYGGYGVGTYGVGYNPYTTGYLGHRVIYGKREAEAEPEPYHHYGYGVGTYGVGYHPYTTGYLGHRVIYGKREAEAEPEPYHHYGYGVGTYGVGYH